MGDLEPILTEGEAAKHLRVSIYTLRSWRRQSKGPAWLRLGEKKPGYKQSSLVQWIDRQQGQHVAA